MKSSIVISDRVLNTINSISGDERIAVVTALAGEFLLGATINDEDLSPTERALYGVIRGFVVRDSARMQATA